jgi:tetratricopeptide (TPR) repeat protein
VYLHTFVETESPAHTMHGKERNRTHHFEFPGNSGHLSVELGAGCFSDVDSDELYRVGKILSGFLYGLLLEKAEDRRSSINLFHTILKDTSLTIEDKDLHDLLRASNRAFRGGDYQNSLFLSKLLLTRINQIIDKRLANNERRIEKEIIKLQISTLNFIGYLFSKMGKNIDYGIKLATIARSLLKEFDDSREDIISMNAAVYDTLGALYIHKGKFDKAIGYLLKAYELDRTLLSMGQVDEIGIRLTCSNLGYALTEKCRLTMENGRETLNIHQIEGDLEKAERYFNMVQVDKPPVVPDNLLKDLELLAAVRRMKEGLVLCGKVKKDLQKRLL